MNEKNMLPVTVTRGPSEMTVEMDPSDIIGFRQGDESITRFKLTLDGATVAIMQKSPGGLTVPKGLPDLTQEEVSGFLGEITDADEKKSLRARIEAAMHASVDRCARCKVCGNQVDAVMAVLGYPPENAN